MTTFGAVMRLSDTNFIKPSEHVFVCGGTGSGKSVLADVFTAGMPETVIKIDIKDDTFARRKNKEPLWRGLVENEDFEVVTSLEAVKKSEFKKIIYVPPFTEQEPEVYDDLARYCYNQGDTRLWVDELMLFTESAVKYPPFLKAILVSGRSRNSTVLVCTQRPMGIPAICIANSQHFFVFRMNNEQDRKKMADVTGCRKFLEPPRKYCFWYYREGADAESVRQWKLKL